MPYTYPDKPLGTPFVELQRVDSTNNYALARIRAGMAEHGMAVFAHDQVAGKGQRGKNWVSEPGHNIALSIILQPAPLAVSEQFFLSACAAVSACELFARYAGDDTRIKWPNDVYWKDRKAGGILIESVLKGAGPSTRWEWAVVGTGLNINQVRFPETLSHAVSLRQVTGKKGDPLELAHELCTITNKWYSRLLKEGPGRILATYHQQLYRLGEKIRLKKGARIFEGLVRGVANDGRLVVEHGVEERFAAGEVEWMKA